MIDLKNKCVVFDIDGTLCDIRHRLHHLGQTPKDWESFKKKIVNDKPFEDIIWMSRLFFLMGIPVIICTAREEFSRELTLDWLVENNVEFEDLFMRQDKDFRDDGVVKKELLAQIRAEWGEPLFWFDDRDRVVKALREEGVRVLQVANGDF